MDFSLALSRAMATDMQLIIEGYAVICRQSDGYVNASALCKAGGKLLPHWSENKKSKDFISELSLAIGIPMARLVVFEKKQHEQATWVHPRVAINIAQWISPKFDVAVSGWIHELLVTGSVTLHREMAPDTVMALQLRQLRRENEELTEKNISLEDRVKELLIGMDELKMEARALTSNLTEARVEIRDTHEIVSDLAMRAVPAITNKDVMEVFMLFQVPNGFHMRGVRALARGLAELGRRKGVSSAKSAVKTKYGAGNFTLIQSWNCAPNSIMLKHDIRERLDTLVRVSGSDIYPIVPLAPEAFAAAIDDLYRARY